MGARTAQDDRGADPALLDGDASGAEIRPASATVTVWTLPWAQLILIALLVALALAARTAIRRRKRRLADLLAQARDEGRAEARESTLVGTTKDPTE
ncbi:hypothetical protein [Phytohabitans flavus]|uniref:hypothetical protein n=1 Tax=Phytohabitans flavus TaxID=1076124 RepID=UPI001E649F68|nr:hypothetical protein [Phytohabitans flavus]